MRSILFFVSVSIAGVSCARAEPMQAGALRAVQVIDLSQVSKPSLDDREAGGMPEASALAAVRSPSFLVHDLGRQWVTFQMGQSLNSASYADSEAQGQEPLSHGSNAGESAGAPLVVAGVTIPQWMRGQHWRASAPMRFVPGCVPAQYRPAGFLSAETEDRRQGHYAIMTAIACEYGIPVGLFDAMIIRESRYRSGVYSPKNAYGLTQLMPGTAAGLGVNRYDVEDNLRGGARYLREQLERFGQVHLALAAYNAGPGRVRNGQIPRISETQGYVEEILLNWSRLSGGYRHAVTAGSFPANRPSRATGALKRASVSTF